MPRQIFGEQRERGKEGESARHVFLLMMRHFCQAQNNKYLLLWYQGTYSRIQPYAHKMRREAPCAHTWHTGSTHSSTVLVPYQIHHMSMFHATFHCWFRAGPSKCESWIAACWLLSYTIRILCTYCYLTRSVRAVFENENSIREARNTPDPECWLVKCSSNAYSIHCDKAALYLVFDISSSYYSTHASYIIIPTCPKSSSLLPRAKSPKQ